MEIDPVIITGDSPNPTRAKYYDLICHDHRVNVIVTSKPAVVRKWVHSICYNRRHLLYRARLVVGLGVQWTPGTNTGAAAIQICVGHNCLIFQLQHADQSPAILRRFLSNPDITFVGVWNNRDAAMLSNSHHRLQVTRLVDLRHPASSDRDCSLAASMETLASEILGWNGMVKEEWVGRSDWDVEWLSEEQVRYASLDAFLSFLIGKDLRVWKCSANYWFSLVNHSKILGFLKMQCFGDFQFLMFCIWFVYFSLW